MHFASRGAILFGIRVSYIVCACRPSFDGSLGSWNSSAKLLLWWGPAEPSWVLFRHQESWLYSRSALRILRQSSARRLRISAFLLYFWGGSLSRNGSHSRCYCGHVAKRTTNCSSCHHARLFAGRFLL